MKAGTRPPSVSIHINIIEDMASMTSLKDQWTNLLLRCPDKNPFLSFEWNFSWWKTYGLNNRLFILSLYSDSQLIAIFPLMISNEKGLFLRKKVLSFIGTGLSDYAGPIITDDAEACWAAAIDMINKKRNLWDFADLRRMPEDISQFDQMLSTFSSTPLLNIIVRRDNDCKACPIVPVKGEWSAFYESRWNGKARYEHRRRERRLSEKGSVVFSEISGKLKNPDKIIHELSLVEKKSWKGEDGKGIFNDHSKEEFFMNLLSDFSQEGWLCIDILRVDDAPVGFMLGYIFNDKYYLYNTSYDQAFRAYSPGILMMKKRFHKCYRDKMNVIDFLQGVESYKLDWTEDLKKVCKVMLFKKSFYSRWFHFREAVIAPLIYKLKRLIKKQSDYEFIRLQ